MIIGLCGYGYSGKDSIANHLVAKYEFTRVAFADALKAIAVGLPTLVPIDVESQDRLDIRRQHLPLADIVQRVGMDRAKSIPAVRKLLQDLGVLVRDHIGEDAWVEAAMRNVGDWGRFALSDVRFPNEVAALKDRGGYLVRVVRPGIGAVNAHISETAIDYILPDYQIDNDGTLDDLAAKVDFMMADLGVRV